MEQAPRPRKERCTGVLSSILYHIFSPPCFRLVQCDSYVAPLSRSLRNVNHLFQNLYLCISMNGFGTDLQEGAGHMTSQHG